MMTVLCTAAKLHTSSFAALTSITGKNPSNTEAQTPSLTASDETFERSKNTPLSFRGQRTGAGRKEVALLASHATGHTEGRGDGGEDGDNHVDDHLPGFCLVFYGHNELGVRNQELGVGNQELGIRSQGVKGL